MYRVLYVQFYILFQNSNPADGEFSFSSLMADTLGNVPSTLLMVLCNFWFAKLLNRKMPYGTFPVVRFSFELLYLIIFSIGVSVVISYRDIFATGFVHMIESGMLGLVFLSVLLVNTLVLYIINIFLYYRNTQREALRKEKIQREKAQYQYSQLKKQLNPHFLFNSLNVLDSLVHSDSDRASRFISKLAGVYRYLLSQEHHDTVKLEDELIFVQSYVELMKERFVEGLFVRIDIPREWLGAQIVPCGLQTMVENAIKHNVVSIENPLTVSISVREGGYLVTSNDLHRKFHSSGSGLSCGVGLRNINQQYQTLFDQEIIIVETQDLFEVSIPLIR